MTKYHCPRCKTPVVIPKGRPGGVCKKCRRAVLIKDIQDQPQTGMLYLRLFLALVIMASCGLLSFYVVTRFYGIELGPGTQFDQLVSEVEYEVFDSLVPEPGENLKGKPRARNVTPRHLSLWELHANDTVRIVEVTIDPSAKGSKIWLPGPSMDFGQRETFVQMMGGTLLQEHTSEETYMGQTYSRTRYELKVSRNEFGYDMQVKRPSHLHINGDDRLISLGIEPKSYAQEIIAVAIPVEARITSIYDFQPYRHITLGKWDVFYYDTSQISRHVSIHISYRSVNDASSLNWAAVEARR
ncbi:MAG: hypothetical protein GY771_07565 [bacterium]|nr:hypothetical protein [bacterium]